jgi:hypothetical protein
MASDEREGSTKSADTMHTENLNLAECPSRREQHPTNLPLLPTRRPAGVSGTQPTANLSMRTDWRRLRTDLLLICDDSRLQDLERALDDRPPDTLICDLLQLKGLDEF